MDPQELVADVSQLISLPEVAMRVTEIVDDPGSSTAQIGRVISEDPNLTARILRIANSPVYAVSSSVDTVSRAVTVLGAKQVRDLTIGIVASKELAGIPNQRVSMDIFWSHSLYCGILAELLAVESGQRKAEAIFVAGLLHDIGQLVMFNKMPELAKEALLEAVEGPDDRTVDDVEREVIGFDHAQVGGELARAWGLPAQLEECVEFHHQPENAKRFPVPVSLVHIANCAAVLAEIDSEDEYELPPVHDFAWEVTGLSFASVVKVLPKTREHFRAVRTAFMM